MAEHSLVRGLIRDWETVAEHEAKPDPHPQYIQNEEGLRTFTFAAYGGLLHNTGAHAFPNLGATWQHLDFMDTETATPLHVTVNTTNSSLSADNPGVYMLTVSGVFSHNSSNSGRSTRVRLYDLAGDVPLTTGLLIGTGRNAEASNISASVLTTIAPEDVGEELILQIGGGDAYSAVEFTTLSFSLHSVGEYQGVFV